MKKRPPLFLIIFLFISFAPKAQQKMISGVIKDSHSEEIIPFASISFKNSTVGKLSDSSGSFTFYLSKWPSDTLDITCVGYQPYRYIINRAKDSIFATISMERGTFNEGVKV